MDLLPTMLSIASSPELTPRGLDGLSLWDAVRARVPVSPRTGLVYNIDDRWIINLQSSGKCGSKKKGKTYLTS